jgi:hypothetical protein
MSGRAGGGRLPYGRAGGKVKNIARLKLQPFTGATVQNKTAAGGYAEIAVVEPFGTGSIVVQVGVSGYAELAIEPFGVGSRVIDVVPGGYGHLSIEPFGEDSRKLTEDLYFIDEPTIQTQAILATHLYITSPTHQVIVSLPGIADENRIEKKVDIGAGNAETCQAIGEQLLEKWGRTQRSLSGEVDLVVTTKFKQKMRVWVPSANIDEFMPLQKKEHNIVDERTRLTLGDIILNESEYLARVLRDAGL